MRNNWYEWSAVAKITNGTHENLASDQRCPQCFKNLVFDIDIPRDEEDPYRLRLECWGCGYWTHI